MSRTPQESASNPSTAVPRPRSWPATLFAVLSVALLFTLLHHAARVPGADVSDGAQLLLSTAALQANSTFELRFDEPVAAPEELDHPGVRVPVEVVPPLRGEWVWLSRRSGIFTPAEPMDLGARYTFQLRPGLRTSAGALVSARLQRSFVTPAFTAEFSATPDAGQSFSANTTVRLRLNAAVTPDALAAHAEFRAGSLRVPVRVERSSLGATWHSAFRTRRAGALEPRDDDAEEDDISSLPPLTRVPPASAAPAVAFASFALAPSAPLTPGVEWTFVLRAGLPSPETRRVSAEQSWKLGRVTPFALAQTQAESQLNSGRRVALHFSHSPAAGVETNFAKWFTVSPTPPNLRCDRDWVGVLRLRGDFALDTDYTLVARAGLPAADGQSLTDTVTRTLRFEPLAPRVWFPAFDAAQLARGGRDFQLLALNTPSVRLSIKQLDAHTLLHALRGYEGYTQHRRHQFNAPSWVDGHTLDWNQVPGRTIFQSVLETPSPTDQVRREQIPWKLHFGSNETAAVMLFAEPLVTDEQGRQHFVPGPQALVQLTDLGVVWKGAGNDLLVWVFSHATGRPVTNATVRAMTAENVELSATRTDARGVARLTQVPHEAWLLAETSTDRHALRINRWETDVPFHRFQSGDVDGFGGSPAPALLFSDRDAYRPGETVQLKAILRESRDGKLQFPTNPPVELRVHDARGEVFLRTNLTLSARGSLDYAVKLPEGPRGNWSWSLTMGNLPAAPSQAAATFSGPAYSASFQVRDFKPNAFEIALDAPREFAAAAPVRVPVSARYFLGQPLTRAKVSWELEAHDAGFTPAGWGDFQFPTQNYRLERLGFKASQLTLHDEAQLAPGTNLVLTPEVVLNAQLPQPRSVRLLAEVTDLNQQTLSRATGFTVHSSDFYLGVRQPESARVGQPLPVFLVAVRADGTPTLVPVKATLQLRRVEWHTVRHLGAGKTIAYRSEPVFSNVVEQAAVTLPVRRVGVKWELAEGASPALLPAPTEAGEYLLEARATDAAGRAVLTVIPFHVNHPEPKSARKLAWDYRNDVQIELVPDRKSYRVGDTATIVVKTPISGTALVTIEREGVRREWVTNLVGNAPALRIPLEPGDAPNVFVGVLLLRGHADSPRQFPLPEYRAGFCNLRVEQPEERLEVRVLPSATEVRPRGAMRAVVVVRDHADQPVRDAEVTLYAVDEGVLSLTDYATPQPFEFFHRPRALGVRTDISLPTLLPEDPELRSFQNKGHSIGGGGQDSVRRNFQPLAFWRGALLTDARGEVTATFPAPDSLTRYRLIAVAHAGATRFGSGRAEFEVNKPLMLEPSLPRFAHVGDKLVARAVALNKTELPGEVEVTLQLDTAAGGGWFTNRVTLAAQAAAPVDFPVTITSEGTAKWLWRARFIGVGVPAFADAAESTLLVTHPAPLRREVRYNRVTNDTADLLLGLDPKVLAGRGHATVRVANSRLLELGECVQQLLHYPYGCVEQTTSSMLPWFVLMELPDMLPLNARGTIQPDAAISSGVQQLLAMQTSDGGLSYWPGGREPQFWGSAYGGLALVLARDAGYPVPERSLEKLLAWLRGQLDRSGSVTESGALAERCLALYTLARAGKPAASHHEVLFQRRDWLSAEDRTLLALAVLQANGPRAMAAELLNGTAPTRPSRGVWFGCAAREKALQLLAWSKFQPDAPIVERLAEDLLRSQRAAHWGTTQGNAWALLALVAYADAVERESGSVAGEVVRGGSRQSFRLGARSAQELDFTFSPTNAPQLALANPERKQIFTQLTVESRDEKLEQAGLDRGFRVTRTHERLDDENKPVAGPWRVGDRVLVTLRVEAHERAEWVAIEDPLPAVLEAVTPEFKSDQTRGAATATARSGWWADHRELRQDRMLYFRNHLPEGTHVIRYLARVRAAGDATAPSTKVEAMYEPERVGLSGSVRVKAE